MNFRFLTILNVNGYLPKEQTRVCIYTVLMKKCCSELSSVIILMMEAVRTSETSVDNYFTRQYIPEDNSEHHTRRRENLKSHIEVLCFL
jgi:hypothetical protein